MEYREKYQAISKLLDLAPDLLALAHKDFLERLCESSLGRSGAHTTEQLLRALIVMFVEQRSYRKTVVMIENSEFLRSFVRLGVQPAMDYTFLCRAFSALSPETWAQMNDVLGTYGKERGKVTADKVRLDTTVYEANIHWPTDSSLLWDGFRTLARLLKKVSGELRGLGRSQRFHLKKIKRLAQFIARHASAKSKRMKRKVQSHYRTLIERVRRIVEVAKRAVVLLESRACGMAEVIVEQVRGYLPIVARIVDQAARRVLNGESVPSPEKVYSLFESHTELLKRGKAGKPVEFGHKVLIAETKEKFIFHYDVFPRQRADKDLLDETLGKHKALFDNKPQLLAADKGFYESGEKLSRLRQSGTERVLRIRWQQRGTPDVAT